MDKITQYKQTIQAELEYYASIPSANAPELEMQVIISQEQKNFILFNIGWHNKHYIHSPIFHLEIRNDKIWVHEDRTDYDIAWKLVEKGIPQSDIVLGFVPNYGKTMAGFSAG